MYTTKIGHAHLKVRDLDRSVAFYERFLKLHVTERVGDQYVFMTGGGFHHELALQQVGPDAPTPASHSVGLYHVAFEVPSKRAFAEAFQALTEADVLVGAVDHFISWAMYFDDPDGNGLEIYWDTRGEPGGKPLWRGENVGLTPEHVLAALAEEEAR